MLNKLQKVFYQASEVMEIVLAVVVAVAVAIAVVRVIPGVSGVWSGETDLMQYLGQIFEIVIAVEFLKMLCKPTFDTVIEVLIFLVARHMIITETTALEDLTAVISIVILFFVQHFIRNGWPVKNSSEDTK